MAIRKGGWRQLPLVQLLPRGRVSCIALGETRSGSVVCADVAAC